METFCDWNKVHLHKEEEVFAMVYFGKNKACKTESDAREAAELLKAFFEAKAAGRSIMLRTDGHEVFYPTQRPIVNKMDTETGKEFLVKCTCGPLQFCGKNCDHEQKAPQVNDKHERHARQQIARMAAMIVSADQSCATTKASVNVAAEIWKLSQSIEL